MATEHIDDPLAGWYTAVGPGWEGILKKLSVQLADEGVTSEQVAQVKEKFGGLRVYLWTTETQNVDEYITAAKAAADVTCERCGTEKEVVTEATWPEERRGWIKTMCPTCWAERRRAMTPFRNWTPEGGE